MNVTKVFLLGLGGVGRELVRQILRNRAPHKKSLHLRLELAALGDSSGIVHQNGAPLTDEIVKECLRIKAIGGRFGSHPLGSDDQAIDVIDTVFANTPLVVDCTATEETVPTLLRTLELGGGVVLANKKPLTAGLATYRRLTSPDPRRSTRRIRWESTVGAGVPVIAALNRLTACGDQIHRIEGATSGTLGALMTGLQDGRRFSEIVIEAKKQGATEPDPRDDLSGMDAARKALILARGIGLDLELSDVGVEALYPEAMNSLTVTEFMNHLPELDEVYEHRSTEARDRGRVLRYGLEISSGVCRVGLMEVLPESPLGRLQGSDNLVAFTTGCYRPTPLVLQGRGAGVEGTAAGVLSDIVELAS